MYKRSTATSLTRSGAEPVVEKPYESSAQSSVRLMARQGTSPARRLSGHETGLSGAATPKPGIALYINILPIGIKEF